jgi:tRNA (adenine-N(1)-)-methyltransferase non-catalytic subunit
MAAFAARLMGEGDTVILECRSNPHVVDIKFTQLKKGQTVSIAKGKVAHDMLIGQPFGTRFEIRGRDGITPVTEQDGGITNEILGDLAEEAGAAGRDGDGAGGGRDNRQLVDRNAMTHGRECSQKLGADEIKELKDQGKGTKEVMKALIDNSDTFKQKTEFSQAKWLKKKAAKHAPQFTTARPSALTLCRAYFRKEPFKINHMREDTLARLLTLR